MQTAVQPISELCLQRMSERIECSTGLHFPPARFADLQRGLAQASRESGCSDPCVYAESLLSRDLSHADIQVLAGSLTIGETHFFRDDRAFEFLETTLLPELIAAKRCQDRTLRIWSAGCAAGEEPYSIAILLHRLIPDLKDWHITILGTDINPKVLARAASGIYSEWSFRDTPAWVKPRYFVQHPHGHYAIQPWLKPMVKFACLNLADPDYPSVLNHTHALDLIICRNVLLYFAPSRIPQVVRRFHQSLLENGHLVIGAVEACQIAFPAFTSIPAPGVALYRKNGASSPQTIAPWNEATMIDRTGNMLPPVMPEAPIPLPAEPAALRAVSPAASPLSQQPPEVDAEALANQRSAYAVANDFYAAGRYPEARATLLAVIGGPRHTDPRAAILLIHCHANVGELAEALVWCERALATIRTDVQLHFLHASILQELQRDEEALLALRNVLFLEPGHVSAHVTMANLHRRRNEMAAANQHLANVRKILAQQGEHEKPPRCGGLTVGHLNATS